MACAPTGTSQWRKSRRRIRRRTLAVFKLNALSSHTRTHTHARAHMRIHAHSLVFFPNGVRELVEDPLSLSLSHQLSHTLNFLAKKEKGETLKSTRERLAHCVILIFQPLLQFTTTTTTTSTTSGGRSAGAAELLHEQELDTSTHTRAAT